MEYDLLLQRPGHDQIDLVVIDRARMPSAGIALLIMDGRIRRQTQLRENLRETFVVCASLLPT